jgi:hypothetical protein
MSFSKGEKMTHMRHRLSLDQSANYKIQVQGRLDPKWIGLFNNMELTTEHDESGNLVSTLKGLVNDQAALYGLLNQIRDLGLPLLAVNYLD